MAKMITTYLFAILLVSLGFFGVGALASASKAEPFRLTSVIYSADRKLAIVDDQMLAVGDRIRGAELVELTRDSAHLLHKGELITLHLRTELSAITKQAVKSDL